MTLADRYLRISALFERSDLVHIDGQWCLPIDGLGEVLAQGGLRIVKLEPSSGEAERIRRGQATFCIWHGVHHCYCDRAANG